MYLVIEIQTQNGTVSALNYQYDDIGQAESKYFAILSAAAVSNLDVHAAMVLDCRGVVLKNYFYDRRENT